MITTSKRITTHFHSTEFRCKCGCGRIYIDEGLVNKLEQLFAKLNASKCIISSGYRCSKHDKNVGGNGYGQHTKGYAADCVYYDKKGKIIPSKIVVCTAYDTGLFKGMANINNNYQHLDVRTTGTYRGDETRGNSSYWTNPYSYYGVSKADIEKYTGATSVSYYKRYTGNSGSIVDALNTIGVNSSFSNRKAIAIKNGISNYSGTASQNIKLLNLLKQGKLITK
jgi:hypothetical protein